MQGPCIELTSAARSVMLLKINGHSATKEKPAGMSIALTRTSVGGYDWTIDYYPVAYCSSEYWSTFRITLTSDATDVAASIACRLVDQNQTNRLDPSTNVIVSDTFRKGQYRDVRVVSRNRLAISGYLKDDSFVVQCVITVLLDNDESEKERVVADVSPPASAAVPSSYDLSKHFGDLMLSQKGTDVTFLVSGETIAAHKCVLAVRSPVFMAELLGDMREKASQQIEIEDMEADVFRALIQFIYTDMLPELDGQEDEEDAKAMAQHLLAAADRYGMERLKLICEDKLCGDIGVETAIGSLVLAEQHECPKLKAKCIEFILATPSNLQTVAASEGYGHLMARCPSVVSDLLLAVMQRVK